MNTLTIEDYNDLKPYEQHLTRAYKANYMMGLTDNIAVKMLEIYQRTGGNKKINIGCSACTLRMAIELGEAYFKFVPPVEEKPVEEEKKEEKKEKPAAKKAGNKKKVKK